MPTSNEKWTVTRHTTPTKVDVLALDGAPICRFYAGRADEALIAKMLEALNKGSN